MCFYQAYNLYIKLHQLDNKVMVLFCFRALLLRVCLGVPLFTTVNYESKHVATFISENKLVVF